jgi:hypothetical protein
LAGCVLLRKSLISDGNVIFYVRSLFQ